MSEIMIGTVKWFSNDKGYGFIIGPDGADCFVHYRSINPESDGYKTLSPGDQVRFVRVRTDIGWSAAEVLKRQAA